MGKKSNKEYTTIQVRKEISEHIRKFCKDKGLVISAATEQYWVGLISASMSGSISITGV